MDQQLGLSSENVFDAAGTSEQRSWSGTAAQAGRGRVTESHFSLLAQPCPGSLSHQLPGGLSGVSIASLDSGAHTKALLLPGGAGLRGRCRQPEELTPPPNTISPPAADQAGIGPHLQWPQNRASRQFLKILAAAACSSPPPQGEMQTGDCWRGMGYAWLSEWELLGMPTPGWPPTSPSPHLPPLPSFPNSGLGRAGLSR